MKKNPMKIPTFNGIDVGEELSMILSREVSKEIALSLFNKAINNQHGFDSAINANMQAYIECVGHDGRGAVKSLTRAIQLTLIGIINKHCI